MLEQIEPPVRQRVGLWLAVAICAALDLAVGLSLVWTDLGFLVFMNDSASVWLAVPTVLVGLVMGAAQAAAFNGRSVVLGALVAAASMLFAGFSLFVVGPSVVVTGIGAVLGAGAAGLVHAAGRAPVGGSVVAVCVALLCVVHRVGFGAF